MSDYDFAVMCCIEGYDVMFYKLVWLYFEHFECVALNLLFISFGDNSARISKEKWKLGIRKLESVYRYDRYMLKLDFNEN